ncbi:MAG: LytS/YhcK type 5TM receptor domain-containing protein, partial [Nitrososphaerota archaeon]
MNPRYWAFAIIMGALGNALAALTVIPTMVQQVALDFSLLPAIIAGIYGGWALGGLTGFIAGILPSIWFGPLGNLGPLGITASIGKAIMGITVGLLSRAFRRWLEARTWLYIPVVALAFLPEALWIYLVFAVMVPLF